MTISEVESAPPAGLAAPAVGPPRFHHIGIQTADLANCAGWYLEFFECRRSWSLSTFSELTRRRLPGIVSLTELTVGPMRIHLFERQQTSGRPASAGALQFQHLCLQVESAAALLRWRQRWLDLYQSGRYRFALAELPTEVVTDADGVQSFYAYDVNGLELELTYVPRDAHDR